MRHFLYRLVVLLEIISVREENSEEQLFRVTDAAIQFFADHANAGERFKFTIDRVGEEKLYEVLKGAYDG